MERLKWRSIENLVDVLGLVAAVVVVLLVAACDTRSELKYSNPAHQLEFCLSSVPTEGCQGSQLPTTTQKKAVGSDANGNPAGGS